MGLGVGLSPGVCASLSEKEGMELRVPWAHPTLTILNWEALQWCDLRKLSQILWDRGKAAQQWLDQEPLFGGCGF